MHAYRVNLHEGLRSIILSLVALLWPVQLQLASSCKNQSLIELALSRITWNLQYSAYWAAAKHCRAGHTARTLRKRVHAGKRIQPGNTQYPAGEIQFAGR